VVEEVLAGIWGEVLGVERVGVTDNFFELGGDSILSIQVVARASQAGLHLTARDIFQRQTVAELAEVARPATELDAEQGVVAGEVRLTPIQRWFFEQDRGDPSHFNQSVLLEVPGALDGDLLESALRAVVRHHDALRMRFRCEGGDWQAYNEEQEMSDLLWRVELGGSTEEEGAKAMEEAAERVQQSLDLGSGPLLRGAWFQLRERPGRLLLVVHHLVIDGVSWRILLEDLEQVYRQLERGDEVRLAAKTTSYRTWARRLEDYASSGELEGETEYWLRERTDVGTLPVDRAGGRNTVASVDVVATALSEGETGALLKAVPEVYRTQINDVLLTALARAHWGWTGRRRLLLEMEGHGREDLFDDVDVSRTVGWFTSIYPIVLDLDQPGDMGRSLKSVKEQLRAVPRRGIGYGLLRYLRDGELRERRTRLGGADICFNYLGQMNSGLEAEGAIFRQVPGRRGLEWSRSGRRAHLVDITAAVVGGRLQISWIYSRDVHARGTIARLADEYSSSLRALIEHCLSEGAGGHTPSDFPLAALDQAELDELLSQSIQR
jgi:non-ribosomal peptide synthase protein (TIGR01720 family)